MIDMRNCPRAEMIGLIPGILELRDRIRQEAEDFPEEMRTLLYAAEEKEMSLDEALKAMQDQIYQIANACSPDKMLPKFVYQKESDSTETYLCPGSWIQKNKIEKMKNQLSDYQSEVWELNAEIHGLRSALYDHEMAFEQFLLDSCLEMGAFLERLLPELEVIYRYLEGTVTEINYTCPDSLTIPIYLSRTEIAQINWSMNEIKRNILRVVRTNEGFSEIIAPFRHFQDDDEWDVDY